MRPGEIHQGGTYVNAAGDRRRAYWIEGGRVHWVGPYANGGACSLAAFARWAERTVDGVAENPA